jgi:hypothetical protein
MAVSWTGERSHFGDRPKSGHARLLSFACSAVVTIAGWLIPSGAQAKPFDPFDGCPLFTSGDREVGQATDNMRRGIEEYRKKNWQEAYAAFRNAWCDERSAATAATLASAEMKLEKYGDAARHWEFVLKDVPAERAALRADAEQQLAECRTHLGRVRVAFHDPKAKVYVGGLPAGDTRPGDDIWLEPGEYELMVSTDSGPKSWVSTPLKVTVQVGQIHTVMFRPPETAPSPAQAAPPASGSTNHQSDPGHLRDEPRPEGSSARTAVLITGASLTAVAVGAGVFFVLQANTRADEWSALVEQTKRESQNPDLIAINGQCGPPPGEPLPPSCSELWATVEDWDAARNRALGSFIAAGVFGGATVATYFLWPAHEKKNTPSTASVAVAPWADHGARGVQVRVGF